MFRLTEQLLAQGLSVRTKSVPEGYRAKTVYSIENGCLKEVCGRCLTSRCRKGRLGDQVYEALCRHRLRLPRNLDEDNRKLVFESAAKRRAVSLVKPADVAIYVEHGAADVGVAGKDILLE